MSSVQLALTSACVNGWGETGIEVNEKNVNVGVPGCKAQASIHDGIAFILVNALYTQYALF